MPEVTSPRRQIRTDAPAVPHVRVPTALLLDETVPDGAVRLWALLDDRLRSRPAEVFTSSQLGALLLVSRATAQRYASALEAAGWLVRGAQVGQHQGVSYTPLRRARCVTDETPGPREVSHGCDTSTAPSMYRARVGRDQEEQGARGVVGWSTGSAAPSPSTRWCGACDSPGYRFVVDDDGRNPRRCPACHPASTAPAPF